MPYRSVTFGGPWKTGLTLSRKSPGDPEISGWFTKPALGSRRWIRGRSNLGEFPLISGEHPWKIMKISGCLQKIWESAKFLGFHGSSIILPMNNCHVMPCFLVWSHGFIEHWLGIWVTWSQMILRELQTRHHGGWPVAPDDTRCNRWVCKNGVRPKMAT